MRAGAGFKEKSENGPAPLASQASPAAQGMSMVVAGRRPNHRPGTDMIRGFLRRHLLNGPAERRRELSLFAWRNRKRPPRSRRHRDVSARAVRGAGKRRGRGHRAPILAVLDLGSNNCRLLVARPAADGGFRVVDSFSAHRAPWRRRGADRQALRCRDRAHAGGTRNLRRAYPPERRDPHTRHRQPAAGRGADNAGLLVERARAQTGHRARDRVRGGRGRARRDRLRSADRAQLRGRSGVRHRWRLAEIIWMRRESANPATRVSCARRRCRSAS